ncbi:MAG: dienelactone hydrolase family protein [Candidatus Borkfalkiaceae bacterium]|nr:dienelactone hydrolase family protein [Christensenellaceae bacterium]
MEEMASKILTPSALWKDFRGDLPLKESKINEMTYDGISYTEVYFSGRETETGRVRIYGLYARPTVLPKNRKLGGILVLPDFCETVNLETVNHFAKQGYSVFMADYRGDYEGVQNHTNYPTEIDYANFIKTGDNLFKVPLTAKETCWYEWVAVAKYSLAYLKSKSEVGKIGVLGIKQGGNVGWQLVANEPRVSCFVTLFGIGWQAYNKIFKYSGEDKELVMNDERYRYLGGVDAHAYAQYVDCPVLYVAGTNSSDFDCDRGTDTIARVKEKVPCAFNFAPRLKNVVDKKCDEDIAVFFKKYLAPDGTNVDKYYIPSAPQISVAQGDDNRTIFAEVVPDCYEKLARVNVYFGEGIIDPSKRNWTNMAPLTKRESGKKYFKAPLGGGCDFVTAFATVEYKNGVTVSSRVVYKKIQSEQPLSTKMLYNSKSGTDSFTVVDEEKNSLGGAFFLEQRSAEMVECSSGIAGVISPFGLLTYKIGEKRFVCDERSIVKLDVYCEEFTELKISLTVSENDKLTDYSVIVKLKGSKVWQNVQVTFSELKSDKRLGIKDFSCITALKLKAESRFAVNNILLI